MRKVTAQLTEQFWFKLQNKCRYYDISIGEVSTLLLHTFTESEELDYLLKLPEHMSGGYKNAD